MPCASVWGGLESDIRGRVCVCEGGKGGGAVGSVQGPTQLPLTLGHRTDLKYAHARPCIKRSQRIGSRVAQSESTGCRSHIQPESAAPLRNAGITVLACDWS